MTIFDKEIFENKKKKALNNTEKARINHLYATDFIDVTSDDIELIQRHEYNKALSGLMYDLLFELSISASEYRISQITNERNNE